MLDIELRQGYIFKEEYVDGNTNLLILEKKFIRVVQTSKLFGDLDFYCLNFEIDDNLNWTLISKEKLETGYMRSGYCVDTTNKVLNTCEMDIPKNKIDFNKAFYYTSIDWECQ